MKTKLARERKHAEKLTGEDGADRLVDWQTLVTSKAEQSVWRSGYFCERYGDYRMATLPKARWIKAGLRCVNCEWFQSFGEFPRKAEKGWRAGGLAGWRLGEEQSTKRGPKMPALSGKHYDCVRAKPSRMLNSTSTVQYLKVHQSYLAEHVPVHSSSCILVCTLHVRVPQSPYLSMRE